ncbi:MAG: S41 family peptidase [Bacteroidales bacterium]|nr:S41 family peptidase [Bacteroidales bacterium]MDD4216642.1 S41 family peptidase [Bacteroidales bacterium]MDY0141759.1 S41 family peptidase [Bacteroidales bacterium]
MKKTNKLKNISSRYTATFLVLFMFLLMSFTLSRDAKNNDDSFETVKNLDVFYSLYKELNLYYVDPIIPGDIIKTGIDAMLKSLDPYTVYIPESKIEDIKFMTTGQYGGIGAVIRKREEYTIIYQPYEDSPAAIAGLEAGDIILKIDGRSVQNMSSEQVSELLRGEPDTKVLLSIKTLGKDKPIEIEVIRQEIKRNSVPYYGIIGDNNTGYIALSSFTNTAASEVKDAFVDLKKEHDIKSLVLDLRGNPGGLLIEAVKICNLFVNKGELIVSTKGKVAQWDKEYKASAEPLDAEIKLVVIVNRSSASASEIVAGCIQDLDRGVVIGQRTFGKGLVQTTRDLSYNGILKVTTAKYYIPSGRCIQALDYAHRNDDGSVGTIPDSIISEFSTKNGRKVFDGGGVSPDIDVEIEKLSMITSSLIVKDIIFDYANYYKFKNSQIAPVEDFVFTDKDFENFMEFIKDKEFDYKTKTEETLNQLIESSKEEKYFAVAEQELETLTKKFAHDKDKDLRLFKEEIKEMLSQEIIVKYYYEKGGIIYGVKNDTEIKKAMNILQDLQKYNGMLKPQN